MIRLLFIAIPLLSLFLYLGTAAGYGYTGFPLDDAWIHQVFARTLAQTGQWGFGSGALSAGSTSPLWTILLLPAYLLPLDYRAGTYFLGVLLLILTAVAGYRLSHRLFPENRYLALAVALFLLLEWHLNWAAFSGMETLLLTALSLLAIERYLAGSNPFSVGLLSGLATLTRPEGLILASLIGVDILRKSLAKKVWVGPAALALGFALLIIPYIAFHLTVGGSPFPNTFYAKHAEYQEAFAPLLLRPWQLIAATLVGAQVLLLPGFLWSILNWVRSVLFKGMPGRRSPPTNENIHGAGLIIAWWAALILVYTLYLPLAYQHGRYLMPSIPFFILLGLGGTWRFFVSRGWILRQTVLWATIILLLVFWGRGAIAYGQDVRIIETEMVAATQWINANTLPGDIIAAHDIGALGYFGQRKIVDTAGLITPEVIPFIRDEDRLLSFLKDKDVSYLIFFPSWYPNMAQNPDLELVWRSPAPWIREAGEENIAVYHANWQ